MSTLRNRETWVGLLANQPASQPASLPACLFRTVDSDVHIIHICHVIMTYKMELSSLTWITQNWRAADRGKRHHPHWHLDNSAHRSPISFHKLWCQELQDTQWSQTSPSPSMAQRRCSQHWSHTKQQAQTTYDCSSLRIQSPQFHKSVIFIRSVKTGKLPSDWKKVDVIIIFKKGSKQLPVNYRLVSLTFICCKLMEHTVVSQIRHHLDDNMIRNQHDFEHGPSCETQLVRELHQGTIKRGQIDTIMDCTKAFDKIKGVSRGDLRSHGIHCDTGQYWLAGWLVFAFR